MRIFALDTALGVTSLALAEDGEVIASFYDDTPNQQASQLIPQIASLMDEAGLGFDALDLIACSCGPGGFTSVRIGVAAARGLAFSAGIACHGVPLLEIMAYDYFAKHPQEARCHCAIPVGRKDVARHIFTQNMGRIEIISDMELLPKTLLEDESPLCSPAPLTEATILYPIEQAANHLCMMLTQQPPAEYTAPVPLYAKAPDAAIAKPLLKH